jgi:hypothetical protein
MSNLNLVGIVPDCVSEFTNKSEYFFQCNRLKPLLLGGFTAVECFTFLSVFFVSCRWSDLIFCLIDCTKIWETKMERKSKSCRLFDDKYKLELFLNCTPFLLNGFKHVNRLHFNKFQSYLSNIKFVAFSKFLGIK